MERQSEVLSLANESDLVLVGRRRTRSWLLPPLGRNARRALQRSRTPVLVVGRKPIGAYKHVVVATDLKTDLTAALAWTGRVAPLAAVTLLHVYRPLFENKPAWAGATNEGIRQCRLAAQREAAWGLATLLDRHPSMDPHPALLSYGSATNDVARKSPDLGADLVVMTRTNHSSWMDGLGASVSAETTARAEDCDVLVVHESSG
jgi:nucleotide-binding universal stress UspA family protein